jgi:hypothetical protein
MSMRSVIDMVTEPARRHHRTPHHRQDLHCIKPDYIDPNIDIKLYDYTKLCQDIVELYIANINIAKVLHQRGLPPPPTKPRAAVIFDRRRRLRQDPPPP